MQESLLSPGDQIGDWVVIKPLGEGGMGAVYKCHNALSERIQAAVKVLKPHGLNQARERFLREVELLASVQHPSVVRIFGCGEDKERGLLFMAMELIDGEELTDRLTRGPLPWQEACELFRQLGEGLLAAHEKGIVHRDIKPQNIMLCKSGTAKLLDFGIAVQKGGQKLTRQGAVPGTVSYMAPEVFEGQTPDHRADIYALGLVLWETLTGKEAFPEDPTTGQRENMARIMREKLTTGSFDPGEVVPGSIRDLVQRCTIDDPDERLAQLNDFVRILASKGDEPLVLGTGGAPTKETFEVSDLEAPSPAPKGSSGGKLAILGVGAAGLLVLLTSVVVILALLIVLAVVAVGPGSSVFATGQAGAEPTATGPIASPPPATTMPQAPRSSVPAEFPFTIPDDAKILAAGTQRSAGSTAHYANFTTRMDGPEAVALYKKEFEDRGMVVQESETVDSNRGTTYSLTGMNQGEVSSFSHMPYPMSQENMVALSWVPIQR